MSSDASTAAQSNWALNYRFPSAMIAEVPRNATFSSPGTPRVQLAQASTAKMPVLDSTTVFAGPTPYQVAQAETAKVQTQSFPRGTEGTAEMLPLPKPRPGQSIAARADSAQAVEAALFQPKPKPLAGKVKANKPGVNQLTQGPRARVTVNGKPPTPVPHQASWLETNEANYRAAFAQVESRGIGC